MGRIRRVLYYVTQICRRSIHYSYIRLNQSIYELRPFRLSAYFDIVAREKTERRTESSSNSNDRWMNHSKTIQFVSQKQTRNSATTKQMLNNLFACASAQEFENARTHSLCENRWQPRTQIECDNIFSVADCWRARIHLFASVTHVSIRSAVAEQSLVAGPFIAFYCYSQNPINQNVVNQCCQIIYTC